VGQLLRRLIDYRCYDHAADETGETLITRYAWRFGLRARAHAAHSGEQRTGGAGCANGGFVNVPDVLKDPRYLP